MKVLLIAALALVVSAEPPVDSWGMQPPSRSAPSASYGPPEQQYGAPAQARNNGITGAKFTGFGEASAPQAQYGAPARSAQPSAQYGAPANGGYPAARNSGDEDDMSEPASYEYKYEVNDSESGSEFGAMESREGDTTWGEYRVLLPDGRTQVVTYEADQNGYRPMIKYIEPQSQGGYSRGGPGGPY